MKPNILYKTASFLGLLIIVAFTACQEEDNSPKAAFKIDEESRLYTREPVQFNNNSDNATAYSWSIDGETLSYKAEFSHTFSEAGSYEVALKAFNGEKTSTTSKTIDISANPNPVACFTVEEKTVTVNTEVTFTNCSKNATSYLWEFGDDSTSTKANPVHTYKEPGEYTVTLTATNEHSSKETSQTLTVESVQAVLSTGFEDGVIPEGWMTIDSGDNAGTWAIDTYKPHSGKYHISVNTWDDALPNMGRANDWIITPQITISQGDLLSLFAKSDDSDYLDDLNIYISKTGTDPEDFTYTVKEISGVPYDYARYEFNLTNVEGISDGDEIYIGFHCDSNGWYLYLDDLRVGQPRSKNYPAPKPNKKTRERIRE